MRIGRRRSGGPILPIGMKAKGLVGNPPPRTIIISRGRFWSGTSTVLILGFDIYFDLPGVALGRGEAMRRREFIAFVGSTAAAWPLRRACATAGVRVSYGGRHFGVPRLIRSTPGFASSYAIDEAMITMKTILVPTEDGNAMRSALETALILARQCDSYIEGFALRWEIAEFTEADHREIARIEVASTNDL